MDNSTFKVVCDHCDAKLANVFCHSDGAFLCPQCDAQVHSVNKLAQRHLRVPCQSCPIWAYREAKSRGRLLDMPLAACLTRNLQMDIFDGATPCWPSNNGSSAAIGTPKSDTSSPQTTVEPPPLNVGSPNSPVPTLALQQAANSWPQNGMLAATVASQPQPMPQQSAGNRSMSPCADFTDATRAAPFAVSPFSNCSDNLQAAASTPVPPQAPERYNLQGPQISTSAATHQLQQAAQSQHSQHSLQRAASQEVMDAVDSMDVALLLDTFCAPLDQLQEQRTTDLESASAAQQVQQQHQRQPQQHQQQPQQHQQQQQQQQQGMERQLMAIQQQAPAQLFASLSASSVAAVGVMGQQLGGPVGWAPIAQQALQQQQLLLHEQQQAARMQINSTGVMPGLGVTSSEPMAVPSQRQQPAMRSLSGLSGLSQSGLSSSNNDGPFLGSARSSNTMLMQSLEQQMAGNGCPLSLKLAGVASGAGVSAAGWPDLQAAQRQLQQLQQQQAALQQALQLKQQQAAVAALAAAHQQQQAAQLQMLQRSMTEDLPRTSPINIGGGSNNAAATASTLAAATARRDVSLPAGLGLSDPGTGMCMGGTARGLSLAASVPKQPAVASIAAAAPCLTGVSLGATSIAASAVTGALGVGEAGNPLVMLPTTIASGMPAAAAGLCVGVGAGGVGAARSGVDIAASSFGAAAFMAAVVGSGGSTSVSPNCNTLAGAGTERPQPGLLVSQQLAGHPMVLPGSAPPALGLAASVSLVSRGGSCELSEAQLMRLSSDGCDPLSGLGLAVTASTGSLGGSMGMLGLGEMERLDGAPKDLDLERAAQLNRYRQKRMARMRALADGAKKVRYECRKQLADTRPRFKGRFIKVNSSDALVDFASTGAGAANSTGGGGGSGGGTQPTTSVNGGSVCTAPAAGASYPGSWALHGHGHGSSQRHMQRIDEEGANEGQSAFMTASQSQHMQADAGTATTAAAALGAAAAVCESGSRLAASEQQLQQQMLMSMSMQEEPQVRRAQSSSALGAFRGPEQSPTAALLSSCGGVVLPGGGAVAMNNKNLLAPQPQPPGQTDCVITDQDLAALGFEDLLPQLSGGFSNENGNGNEDMDESGDSMGPGGRPQKAPTTSRPPSAQAQAMRLCPQLPQTTSLQVAAQAQMMQGPRPQQLPAAMSMQPQPQPPHCAVSAPQPRQQQFLQQQQPPQRLSVLDRPIMYGTDLSQFSAAQLSLLDSILTDQYKPGGIGGRH